MFRTCWIKLLFLLLPLLLASCSAMNFFELERGGEFPSAGEGTDAWSATTNWSGKEGDLNPKADATAGAGFIAPPNITNYGSVSFSYPVSVTPGRPSAGSGSRFTPSVSLSYSSSGSDGLAGVGWNLSTGLAAVTRSNPAGEICYDNTDTFSYNGRRLVKTSGPAASSDGIYRAEIESDFVKLELRNSSSGGTWYAYDASGTVTVLGETSYERVAHPDDARRVYSWNFTRTYDLSGNTMYAVYDSAAYARDHVLYVKRICYTGNTTTGAEAAQYVAFTYEDREDPYVTKSAGFPMRLSKLIANISVGWRPKSSDTELWNYTIHYTMTEDSCRPVIEKITSTRHSAEPSFVYQRAEHGLVWKYPDNPWYAESEFLPARTEFFEGDFNGDGISDMVLFNPVTGEWKAAEGTAKGGYLFKKYGTAFAGYAGDSKIRFFKGNASGDYNGDGRSDIAFYLPETREFFVAEHNGKVFTFVKYGTLGTEIPDIFAAEWFPGDYDGNGLSDALLYYEPTGDWVLMKNEGGRYSFIKVAKAFKNLYRADYAPDAGMNSALTADVSTNPAGRTKVNFLSGDYNGDGRTDIALYDSRSGNVFVCDVKRAGTSLAMSWKLFKKFTAPESALFSNDRFSGDYNGDGYSDFLLFDRTRGEWIIGETSDDTINFRVYAQTPQFKEITRWLQGDFNGDGRTDIGFYSSTDGSIWVGESTGKTFRYRVYNNINSCPAARNVAENIPLPGDDIRVANGSGIVGRGSTALSASFQYDSNRERGGERVFPGFYNNANGLLVFRNSAKRFYHIRADGTETPVAQWADLSDASTSLASGERAIPYNATSDGVPVLKRSGTGDAETYTYSVQTESGLHTIAAIAKSAYGYTPTTMPNALGYASGVLSLYVLDVHCGKLRVYWNNSETQYTLTGAMPSGNTGMQVLRNGTLLLYNRGTNTWYKGVLSGATCALTELAGTAPMPAGGADVIVRDSSILTVEKTAAGVQIRAVRLASNAITTKLHTIGGAQYNNAVDSDGNVIVETADGARRVKLADESYTLEALAGAVTIARNLQPYAYQWIQGDYNGDGKTDLGFYSLKARQWYYLVTTGTVPDLITEVHNGIGGKYTFTYGNSTQYDSRGDDGVPHLPVNYKMCERMVAEDGGGRMIATNYEYKGGYAYSAYINGRKETDFFGFSEFTVRDVMGNKSVTRYHTVPYDDFLKNRALSGAVKETVFYGYDYKEYARSTNEYQIIEFAENGVTTRLAQKTKTSKYMEGVLITTEESAIEKDTVYGIKRRIDTVTDHYTDGVHKPIKLTNITEIENRTDTNEQRIKRKIQLSGTDHEVQTSYTYNARGQVIIEETSNTGGAGSVPKRTIHAEYDAYGNKTKVTDASGTPSRVTEYEYDTLHSYLTKERVLGPVALVTKYVINYEKAFGFAEQKTDPNGNSVYYEYDDYGRLKTQYADTDSGKEKFAEYEYEQDQYPLSVHVTQYDGEGLEKETKIYADGFGRLLGSVWSVDTEDGRAYGRTGTTTYDDLGRVIRQGRNVWASASDMEEYTEAPEVNATETQYDPAGRVNKVIYPKTAQETEQTYTEYAYPTPWTTITKESGGRSKEVTKNARGQVLYVTDSGDSIVTKIGFFYDLSGNRIKKSDLNNGATITDKINEALFAAGVKDTSGNNICQWKYDGYGRVIESSDADLGYSKTEYNAFGEVTRKTDARGLTTEYVYDSIGRLLEKKSPSGEGSTQYVYDTGANALGKVSEVRDANQSKNFEYDRLGRVKRELREVSGIDAVFETEFTHDNLGRTRSIRYPMDPQTGERVTVEYDYVAAGVKSIKLKQGLQYKMIVEAITYNEHGQMETIQRGNGATTNYYYDEKSRLLQLTTTDKSNDVIQNSTYGYYPDNTIAWKQDETGTGAAYRKTRYDYEYDGLDRIAKANGAYSFGENQNARTFTQDYEYTLTGNITTKRTQESATKPLGETYSYAYNNHAVTTIDSTVTPNRFEFRYDASGNMTYSRDGTKARNIAFDSNNRITKVTDDKNGEVQGEYTYDEQGFRIRKTAKEMTGTDDPSVRVDLIYPSMYFALERKVTLRQAQGGATVKEIPDTAYAINNIYLNGVRIAATKANGEAKYYLTDQVDSVSLVADDESHVETRTEYMPFGETWFQEGDSVNKPKYNSQELDAETGLYFYNARYYDGEIGRFVTADQVIDGEYDTQGWNRYAYVKNGPIGTKDPSGHAGLMDSGGAKYDDYTDNSGKTPLYYGMTNGQNDTAAVSKQLADIVSKKLASKECSKGPRYIDGPELSNAATGNLARELQQPWRALRTNEERQSIPGQKVLDETFGRYLLTGGSKADAGTYCAADTLYLGIAKLGRIEPSMDAYRDFMKWAVKADYIRKSDGYVKNPWAIAESYGLKANFVKGTTVEKKAAYERALHDEPKGTFFMVRASGHMVGSSPIGEGKDFIFDTGSPSMVGKTQRERPTYREGFSNFGTLEK